MQSVENMRRAHISNIEAEIVPSYRFQDVIKGGRFQEGEVDDLDVGEVGHEFHSNAHLSGEAKVLQQDRHYCGRETPADANGEDNLGVDFLCDLFWGHIRDVIGGKGDGPVHHDDLFLCLGESADMIDTDCFVSEGEGGETKGIEERWTVG